MSSRTTTRRHIGHAAPSARLLLLLPATLGLVLPPPAPQGGPAVQRVEVALWPEYDRPAVLVIYRLDLPATTPLPAALAVAIPAAAGEPHAVAEMAGGKLVTLPYRRTVDGTVARIEVTANQAQVQIEYYDPALSREGTRRRFSFAWDADYAVDDLSVVVQQPPGVDAFELEPAPTETTRGTGGLLYQRVHFGAVDADQRHQVQLVYDKVSDDLTIDRLPPPAATSTQPEAPANPPPAGQTAATDSGASARRAWSVAVIVGLLVIAVGLVTAGVAILLRSRREAAIDSERASFCTRCGAAVAAHDRFCGQCGHEVG